MRLIAWIDEDGGVAYVAGYTSSDAVNRPPAKRTFFSREAARQWVADEAHLLGVEVQWIEDAMDWRGG